MALKGWARADHSTLHEREGDDAVGWGGEAKATSHTALDCAAHSENFGIQYTHRGPGVT